MSNAVILIVEDEAIVAADLASKLERLGHRVAGIASEGEAAVALAGQLHPQLVLMDIRLAGAMDGICAAEAIRRERDVPVIYLTAHSDAPTLARAKLTGPFGYILKPFDERDLATQIELALYKHQTDRELRRQREWLRVTLTSIGDAVIATDAEGRISFINPVAQELTGWKGDESLGQPLPNVFHIINEQTGEPLEEPVGRVLREGRAVELANHAALVTRDGRTVPIEDSAAPILDDAGQVIGAVLVFHDVTEKRRAEEELRRLNEELEHRVKQRTAELAATEAKYRGLVENTLDMAYSVAATGEIRYLGPQARRYGLDPRELVGKPFLEIVYPGDRRRMAADFHAEIAKGKPIPSVFRIQTADGRMHWFEERAAVLRGSSGAVVGVTGVLRDITQRKSLEEALARIADQERRRFGQDLHDGLGQELTGLGYLATLLRKRLDAAGDGNAELAKRLTEGIQQAIGTAKKIARGVAPVGPEAEGLPAALESMLTLSETYFGIPCRLRCSSPLEMESVEIASELFRIAQEAVTNAGKYAEAQRIEVELSSRPECVVLTVRDDGVGLPDDLSQSPGMGLRIMRHRAEQLGATLSICSSDRGTEITVLVRKGDAELPPIERPTAPHEQAGTC